MHLIAINFPEFTIKELVFINVDFRKMRKAGFKSNVFHVTHLTNIATNHKRILVAEEFVSYNAEAPALPKRTLF
jgi:hypothetical protein